MIRTRRRYSWWLDAVLLALIAAGLCFVVYRIRVGLHYTWNWSAMPQFLVRYDEDTGHWVANYLLLGLLTTLRLSLWSGLLALLFGLLMALARTGRSLFWKMAATSYVELMRNLPPLVLIFIFYFFIADQITPLLGFDTPALESSEPVKGMIRLFFCDPADLSPFLSAVFTLALFEGAYIAEIIRSGIQSVERQQWEAAHALGLTRLHLMRYIILPQAMRQVLPQLAGQFISLIKDSAIVSVISIQELSYQGTQLMASTYLTIEVWVVVAVMYLFLTFPASLGVEWLETKFARGRV
jgi:polar amino acid transport system permease protein